MRYVLFISAALVLLGIMGMSGYLPLTPSKTISGKPAMLLGVLCLALAGAGFMVAGQLV
jgi:hypothetical protein